LAALVASFTAIEACSAAPLLPLRLFHARRLVGGNLIPHQIAGYNQKIEFGTSRISRL
jgi:hypothetical protein